MPAPHSVYIVECADGTLYTGWTTDVDRRVREHNAGRGARYTRIRRPVRLVYVEPAAGRSEAQRRELQIKRLNRASKARLILSAHNQIDPRMGTKEHQGNPRGPS